MNRIIITGNITRDPETRTTQSGISQCNFTVAVQRSRKNENGVYDADFLPVVAWRATADYVGRYMRKGSKVAVEGAIQTRNYEGQDGQRHYVTEIIADHVEGLDRRESTENTTVAPRATQAKPASNDFTEVNDDDLPFD